MTRVTRKAISWILVALAALGCESQKPAPPPVEPAGPKVHALATPAEALPLVLAGGPKILAVGEYHQTEATAGVPSAVKRFGDDMLRGLQGKATDLVLETWVAAGNCGQVEERATAEIAQTTQRPETTEDELVTLLKRAKGLGMAPHILELSCQDYASLGKGEELDYGTLLTMTRDKLLEQIRAALKAGQGKPGLILVYGGAIHNDLDPVEADRPYSFGPALAATVDQRFVELDLVVPAFADREVIEDFDWYPAYKSAVARGELVLIERNPHSFILVFPK